MINVTLGEVKTQEKKFPKIMQSSDYEELVYFLSPCVGIMLTYSGRKEDLRGVLHENYKMEYFTDYNDPITIQNI